MDHPRPITETLPESAPRPATPRAAPALALVTQRLRLALPHQSAPEGWDESLARLLAWLAIDADLAREPAAPTAVAAPRRGRPRMPQWALPGAGAAAAPLFAPWIGWSPTAFQHGGLSGLPAARFAASYAHDHARAALPGAAGGIDCMLLSPHPATCDAEEVGAVPIPQAGVLKAMIAAARAEGRKRIAIILHARQRNPLARRLLAARSAAPRADAEVEILTIEDALPALVAGARPWDAVIAMPDLRGILFTLIARTGGLVGPWPMLWHGARGVLTVTCEAPGERASRLALDAQALVQTLALALGLAGMAHQARRLHEAWARLRDSGVTTPARGTGAAPYAKIVGECEFLSLLCSGTIASRRPQQPWRALAAAGSAGCTASAPALRVVS